MKKLLKNWKTTLVGLTAIILTILVSAGTINAETKHESENLIYLLVENIEAIIAIVAGLVLVFSKDYDSPEPTEPKE